MKYTAEAFDQMQLLWEVKRFNDHQLRCVLRFKHCLDAETLKKAVQASIEALPILGTRYICGPRPHWTTLETSDLGRAVVMARDETEFEGFVASKVDESIGPQVRVCLLNSEPFSIALKMNHMVCDAADFKAYIYFLAKMYTGVTPDPGYRLGGSTEDRSVRRVLKCFSLGVRVKSLLLESNQNNHSGGSRFPLSESGETRSLVLTRKLGRGATATIKRYGKAKGATLNDVLLTVFYRCLFRRLNLSPGTMLRIPVMVDMRRYLPETCGALPLSNLTSTVITELNCRSGERFEDTLGRVKSIMDQKKRSNLGLNGFIKLDRAYRILGRTIANRLLMAKMNHPLISMTNMGALDSHRMSFGDQHPRDAVFTGSIKYQPYFQLSVSSYDGELALGINLLGNNSDRDRILSFLDEMVAELPGRELVRLGAFQVYPDQKRMSRQFVTSHNPMDPQEEEVIATSYYEMQTKSLK
ncbi:MAG: hypothetical protein WAL45_13485 [Terracidiphilus sp.]